MTIIGAISIGFIIYDAPAAEKRLEKEFKKIEESYKHVNITIEKKFIEGKNILLQDLHYGLGSKGELFRLGGVDYNIIDTGKTYIFKCKSETYGNSCFLKR